MRCATSTGGTRVAPVRWPERHSWSSRVSINAAPLAMSSWASAPPISRTGPRARGSSRSAFMCLPLPIGAVVQGLAQRLEAQHRALHACRADLDPQVVQHVLLAKGRQLGEWLALDLVGQHAGASLADGAAAAGEGHVL